MGTETLLWRIYVDQRYPHIYTLSISTYKNQSTEARGALYIPTYEYNYKVITRGVKYYKNITSLIGANARIHRDVHVWTVQKGAHKIAGDAASQPGEARMGLELQLVCLLRRSKLGPKQEESPSVQAPRPGHENPESQYSPASGDANAKWRA